MTREERVLLLSGASGSRFHAEIHSEGVVSGDLEPSWRSRQLGDLLIAIETIKTAVRNTECMQHSTAVLV